MKTIMKVCKIHGLTEFYVFSRKDTKKGILEVCKLCKKQKRKEHRNNMKIKCLEYLGGAKCSICGYNESIYPLEFHHINKDQKEQTLTTMISRYGFSKIKKELDKCVVVCKNCHSEIHNNEKTIDNIGNRHSHKYKNILCNLHGNKCILCGYDQCQRSLCFHHIKNKSFNISSRLNYSLEKLIEESKKCSLLCLNCHTIIHNDSRKIKTPYTFNENMLNEYHQNKEEFDYCPICSNPKPIKNTYCSVKCSSIAHRKVDRPNKDELNDLIKNNTWVSIGNMFGVSDNAVRKWAKLYGIM